MPSDWALPNHWRWATIEQLQAPMARPIVTGPYGSSIGSRFFVDEGVPVIRGNNLSTERIRFKDDGFVYLTEEKAAEFKNLEAHPGDLVFTAAGTIGQVGIIPEKRRFQRYIISNKQMRARLDTALIEPLFAYYWFTEPYMREHIISRNTGSTIPLINLSVLRSLPLPLPPLATQREIVQTLGALDDKIALLRETNATLEAIAQALFKSWFVDFDPVRAKAEGRDPEGVPPEVADLFPSEFEESALGEIPKGWQVGRLGDLVELAYGKALKATDRRPGNVPVYGSGGITGFHDTAYVEGPSIVVGRKGTVGSIYWEDKPFFPIDTVFFVKPRDAPLTYCFYAMQRLGLENMNTDAAVPGLNRENAYRLPVVIPTPSILDTFDEVAAALRARVRSGLEQQDALALLRDTLLPRLMSGKLRIPELQEAVEEAPA